jgi:hypothetical protein
VVVLDEPPVELLLVVPVPLVLDPLDPVLPPDVEPPLFDVLPVPLEALLDELVPEELDEKPSSVED